MRLRTVLYLLGLLTMLFSVSMLPPMAVGWWYGDGEIAPFAAAFVIMLVLGFLFWSPTRGRPPEIRSSDGFVIVTLFWVALSLLGALPLVLSDRPHLRMVDAVFEAVAGLTTTGASVLTGLDDLPHSINFYRMQLQFMGGMGVVVLAVALLPMLGIGGMQLYRAETPGPMKEDKLTPRITETAKSLWFVYVGLNAACAVAYWVAGMDPFDAVTHAFSTVSLGGFSTHDASLGFYDSAAVEVVAGVFTLIAGVNFALHFLSWRSLSARVYVSDPEFRLYAAVMGVLIAVTVAYLWVSGKFPFWESLYHGFFQVPSIVATNGLVAAGYPADWPVFVTLMLLLGSFFGGCAGSTCGGIKSIRFLLLYRQSGREVKLLIHPRASFAIKFGNRMIDERVMTAVWAFYFLYILAFCALSLALVATGVDVVTAFGSVAAGLNNMGVGYGETAAGFGVLNDTATWLLSFSMLLGRLEIFPLLMLFYPGFWRR
ncbi:MAG: potassium transporter [Gammaproteobacteria bacterium]|jgi:trk system potassium uptake protein TrkH|nr:potassium transporter [Gammaproteobacteria bacterium]